MPLTTFQRPVTRSCRRNSPLNVETTSISNYKLNNKDITKTITRSMECFFSLFNSWNMQNHESTKVINPSPNNLCDNSHGAFSLFRRSMIRRRLTCCWPGDKELFRMQRTEHEIFLNGCDLFIQRCAFYIIGSSPTIIDHVTHFANHSGTGHNVPESRGAIFAKKSSTRIVDGTNNLAQDSRSIQTMFGMHVGG